MTREQFVLWIPLPHRSQRCGLFQVFDSKHDWRGIFHQSVFHGPAHRQFFSWNRPSRVFCFCCDSPDNWNNHTLAYVVRHCLSSLLRPLRFCFRCLNFPQTESRQSLQKVKRRHVSSSRTTGSTCFVAKLRVLRAAGWWWTGVELAERSSTVSCRTRWR